MKTSTERFMLLQSFIVLIMLGCTPINNPFQNTDGVQLLITVPEKTNGFNYCVNDSVPFEVTIQLPHLVKKIGVHYDEHGRVDDTVITTDKPDNQLLYFGYKYKETGRKSVKFSITFRESGNIRDTIFDIDIGIEPTIKNGKNLVVTGENKRGQALTLSVDHEEFGRATYKWFKNSVELTGKEKQSFIFYSLAEVDTGEYYCIVRTDWGEDQSLPYQLSFNESIEPPVIRFHPQNIQATVGSSAKFTLYVKGEGIHYQWQKKEVDISSANDYSYEINELKLGDDAAYRCIVSNSGSSVTSDSARLEVFEEEKIPQISGHPEDQEVAEGDTAWFSIKAGGTNLKYQWFEDDIKIENAVLAVLELVSVTKIDSGKKYHCVVSNSVGEGSSNKAVLSVKSIAKPEITVHPQDISVKIDDDAMFMIDAKGANLKYQWFENGEEIDQATNASYIITAAALQDNGKKFSCVVSNPGGNVTSDEATLTVVKVITIPEITAQPNQQDVTAGNDASFSVLATGGDLTFQWQENQHDISGASGSEYIHKNAKKEDNGKKFRCIVSNSAGKATSKEAVLNVSENIIVPNITEQPQSITVKEKEDVSFSITAAGTNLIYQWSKNSEAIPGADKSALQITSVDRKDNNTQYSCTVKNSLGEEKSSEAVLTVLYAPQISKQPLDLSVKQGEQAIFSVEVTKGNPEETNFQWLENGKEIVQAHGNSFTIISTSLEDNGKKISCIVSNSAGKIISTEATLTVVKEITIPEITEQPKNQEVTEGNNATFLVVAGGEDLKYQWQKNKTNILGAIGSEYIHKKAQKGDNGITFRCIVSNSAGEVTSTEANLKVIEKVIAPKITKQPKSLTVKENEGAQFSITATGTNLAFQWLKNGGKIPGAVQSTLKISSVHKNDNNAIYTCTVENSEGTVKSGEAVLTVHYNPVISKHPQDISVKLGAKAVFKVEVTNGNPEKTNFQWYKGSSIVTDKTDDELEITVGKNDNGSKYSCKISNNAGFENMSNSAELSVYYIEITKQPEDQSVTVGGKATFEIKAEGNPGTLSYQWKKGSSSIGINSNSLTIPNVTIQNAGKYSCTITNGKANSLTSRSVTLTIKDQPPKIISHPNNVRKLPGSKVTFSVSASGTNLTYQWQRNGSTISNNTSAKTKNLIITASSSDDRAAFRCVVSNNSGDKVTSNAATLTVVYTVSYIAEGAEQNVPSDNKQYAKGEKVTIKATKPGRSYHLFMGWTTVKNGTTKEYDPSDIYTMGPKNVTFYAIWKANPKYTLSFNKNNDAIKIAVPAPKEYYLGQIVPLPNLNYTGNDFEFAGWKDKNGNTYKNSSYQMKAYNEELQAQWNKLTRTVTFKDLNKIIGTRTVKVGGYVPSIPAVPSRGELYAYMGFYTGLNGTGKKFSIGTSVTADITVYSYWIPNTAPELLGFNGSGTTVCKTGQTVILTVGNGSKYHVEAKDKETPYEIKIVAQIQAGNTDGKWKISNSGNNLKVQNTGAAQNVWILIAVVDKQGLESDDIHAFQVKMQ